MTQATPTIGSGQSGLSYRSQDNDGKKALLNHHKGSSAPSYAEAGIIWLDDTATPWALKIYDGADWIKIGDVHATNNTFQPYVGTTLPRILNDASDTGSANAYAVAPVPAITAYVTGMTVLLRPGNNNTGASTLAVSGLSAKNIKLMDNTNPSSGMIKTTGVYVLVYDGTNFVLTNPSLGSAAYLNAGTSANNIVQLDGSAKLPAVDGSQLTNISAGSYVLLDTKTASSSSTLDFTTGLTSSYSSFVFVIDNILMDSGNKFGIRVSTDGGSSWITANSSYTWTTIGTSTDAATPTQTLTGSSSTTTRAYIEAITSTSAIRLFGQVRLYDPAATVAKRFDWNINSDAPNNTTGFGSPNTTSAVNGVRFINISGGTFTSGKIYLYGVKNT